MSSCSIRRRSPITRPSKSRCNMRPAFATSSSTASQVLQDGEPTGATPGRFVKGAGLDRLAWRRSLCARRTPRTTLVPLEWVESRRYANVRNIEQLGWPGRPFVSIADRMNEELANRIIDLQAEITALRGAVRMLLHNAYNADDTALAIIRGRPSRMTASKAEFQMNARTRYREGVREAVASLLDPFQPDSDEASRLHSRAPARTTSPVQSSKNDAP